MNTSIATMPTSQTPHDDTVTPKANLLIALAATLVLTILILVFLLPHLWYGFHEISDIPLYHSYASRMAAGAHPYSAALQIEYPPLAVPFFRIPGHVGNLGQYMLWFSITMGVITLLAGALTTLTAARFWPRGGRLYIASALFPLAVALTGAIIVNRYDVVVALVLAGFLLCLAARWYVAAAMVLGMGFALKLTPAALLPLVFILLGKPRRWLLPAFAFGATALVPFLPYLFSSPGGLWHVFQYYLERPLQIESVLGTPLLFGQLLGADWATWVHSHGSHALVAPGTDFLASSSSVFMLLGLGLVYWLIWRSREHLRATPADQAVAVLALILALIAFGKVLSPQYFIWILPAWVLVAARDRTIAILGGLTLFLTQVEFPKLYWSLLEMQWFALLPVVLRNTLVVVLFVVIALRLRELPHGPDTSLSRLLPLKPPTTGSVQ